MTKKLSGKNKNRKLNYLVLPLMAVVSIAVFTYATNNKGSSEISESLLPSSPFNLTVHDTGLEFKVTIHPAPSGGASKSTVQQVLSELNIKLHPQDSITPTLETPLNSGLHIVINRKVFKRKPPVPFETLYVKDENLLYGREIIREWGIPGLKEETYLIDKDGREQILEEKILVSPTPKIIARGTKIVPTGFQELGQASWCKPYSGWGYVAAHPILKRGSKVLVTNLENLRQIVVKIVDWGPDRSIFPERVIDLSPEAFVKLGVPLKMGVIKSVKIEEIE